MYSTEITKAIITHTRTKQMARKLHAPVVLSMLFFLLGAEPAMAQSATNSQFLPFVSNGAFRGGANTSAETICDLSGKILGLATLFSSDAEQNRTGAKCDPILMQVAQARAEDMAANGYFNHTNLAGRGPNYLVQEAGYELPSFYSTAIAANQVESIAYGASSESTLWEALKNSPAHRAHVLGTSGFFAQQNEFGIGYVYDPNAQHKHYWVLLTARPASE